MHSSVVYRIPCIFGKVFIGETRRRLETWIKEKDACRKGELGKSTTAEHAWSHQNPILWEETSVIDTASKWRELCGKRAR